jgi:tRNA nucleotidyltransferase (CCA-adding enzyme)
MNSNGEIVDLLGGREDLENGLIKVVGDTKEKFTNDPLRMLRAIRLSVIYDFKINEEELIFILNNKHLFKEISYERRKEEIGKILVNKNAIKGLNLLKSLNLLDVLEISFPKDIRYAPDYIGMWAQLTFSSKYPFTKLEHTRMNTIRQILKEGVINKVTLFKYGKYDPLVAAYILGVDKLDVMKMYDEMPIHSKEELSISGNTIKSLLGLETSPKIKDIKIDLIKKVLYGDLKNNEDVLKKYILENWK